MTYPVAVPLTARSVMKACAVCGADFVGRLRSQLTCSKACRYERTRQRERANDRRRYAENADYRRRKIEQSKERFAADAEYRAREALRRRAARAAAREARTVTRCCARPGCGAEFRADRANRRYCGPDCRRAESARRRSRN